VLAAWHRTAAWLALAGAAACLAIGTLTLRATRAAAARQAARRQLDEVRDQVMQRERELSITLRSVQELIFRTDAEGALVFVNDRWSTYTGRPVPMPGTVRLWDCVDEQHAQAVRALFVAGRHNGMRQAQADVHDGLGGVRSLELAVMPLREGGSLSGFAGSAVDVTARVLAQSRLQAQLDFNEQLMETSPMPMSVVDGQRRYVRVNQAWERFTGRSRALVLGRPVGLHLPPQERQLHERQDALLLANGRPQRYETVATNAEGQRRDVVVNKLLLPAVGASHRPGVLAVIVDVTEFREAARATLEARNAAEEASRAKSEFIANISHELRTPLQSIIGFSELGQQRGAAQPKLAAMFEDIHAAGARMLGLVNDLLDVAKIESTVGAIHLERCDLRTLARSVARELAPLALPRRLELRLALPPQPLLAQVDPQRLQQVLRNMLANALRFSPDGGVIELSGELADDGSCRITVADAGPGIPPAELESIFEAFVQSSRTKDGAGGTGLGLAICRKILQAHGGSIHARNRPEGGAAFVVELPPRLSADTLPAPL
jgi:PAS domain S-box-containing protein